MRETGPLYNLESTHLSDKTWHKYEKWILKLYRPHLYCKEGWNYTDITMILLLTVSFTLRFTLPPQSFEMSRIFFAVTVIVSYFRVLSFWYVLKVIGPRIIAIHMMVRNCSLIIHWLTINYWLISKLLSQNYIIIVLTSVLYARAHLTVPTSYRKHAAQK